jgi:uncharacterized membrane protein (UPF0127 family)
MKSSRLGNVGAAVGLGAIICVALWAFSGPLIEYIRGPQPAAEQVRIAKRSETWLVHGKRLTVEIVADPVDLAQGLGDRDEMSADHGMVFEMGSPGIYPFWMRHMRFPLDILWIREGRVVEIARNLPVPSAFGMPATHTPSAEADQVLELNAGQAAAYRLEVGSVVGMTD